MMLNGLFAQIVVAAVAIGIAITYVQPTFTKIGELQSSIAEYRDETERVAQVNAQLDQLVSRADSISGDDREDLQTYLPDQVDIVAVPRDITVMAESAGVILRSVAYEGTVSGFFSNPGDTRTALKPTPHQFQVQLEGTYEQIKAFLAATERNSYPLQVGELDIKADAEGFMSAGVRLVTYTFRPAVDS